MIKIKLFNFLFVVMTILSMTFGALGLSPAYAASQNALDFDGADDYVNISSTLNGAIGNNITVEGWFYLTSGSLNGTMLVGESFLGDGNVKFGVYLVNTTLYAGYYPGGWVQASYSPFPLNTWVHVAVTYNQSQILIYLNGTQVASQAASGNLPSGTEEWRIGRRWDGTQTPALVYAGKMDEIRIWNVARSQAQIQADMNSEIAPQAGLVAYYQFNQGVAGGDNAGVTTALDGSGNGYDSTLNNFALNGSTSNWVNGVTLGAPNYTVTFNGNGADGGSMSPQVSNVPAALSSIGFTRSGYNFSRWNTASDGSGTDYNEGATYDFSADLTLYAIWKPANHIVTFDANGGSGTMEPYASNFGTDLPSNQFTRTSYTFSGWNTASDGSGTAYTNGASYDFSADITLYAQWSLTPPTVTTLAATNVTATSATLNGTVNANDNDTDAKFYYHMNSQLSFCPTNVPSFTATPATVTGASDTAISYEFTGLTPETTYYFCAYGLSTGGADMGDLMSFTTDSIPLSTPTVTTQDVDSIQQTTANAHFTITDLGNPHPDSYGVVYSDTNTVPDIATDTVTDLGLTNGTANSTDPMSASLSDLTPGTTYYLRGFAVNSQGTAYGSVVTFTTKPGSFAATSPLNNATGVSTSPTLSWTASQNADDYQYCYAPATENPLHCMNEADPGWISTSGALSVNLSGLQPNTQYVWGARASAGSSYTYFTNAPFFFTTAASNNFTVTFTSTAAHDGWILESSETSGIGGRMKSDAVVLYLGDNIYKKQFRSILSFDTSSLPDNAVITKVTLKLKQYSIVGGGNPVSTFQGFMADVKKGTFGTASLALTDFQAAANKTVGPQFPALTAGWYSLNLTTAKANINKLGTNSGLTQMRLRFKLDDNNNAIADILKLYSGNSAAANRPQLIIEYHLP